MVNNADENMCLKEKKNLKYQSILKYQVWCDLGLTLVSTYFHHHYLQSHPETTKDTQNKHQLHSRSCCDHNFIVRNQEKINNSHVIWTV